jgi:hypothetical protein
MPKACLTELRPRWNSEISHNPMGSPVMRLQRIAAAAACALLLVCPASAQLIGSGHVMGNGTSSPHAPTDTPLMQIMNQSGSGVVFAGNSGKLATVSGTIANGHCRSTDANGNDIDAGGACTVGGGGGTVNAGTTPQFAYYGSTGNAVSGMALTNPLLGPNVNNVVAYGADPTGVTDSSVAFNFALAAALAGANGGAVWGSLGRESPGRYRRERRLLCSAHKHSPRDRS